MADPIHDSTPEFEKALKDLEQGHFVLRLYVAGNTSRSAQAIANLREVCETHLKGRYELEVVDIYQQPELARQDQLIAAPTLIKKLPPPLRRIVGDLTKGERLLIGLDLRPAGEHPENS